MKRLYKWLMPVYVALAWMPAAKAQVDPHCSQYYVYPLSLNPGLTGAMEGDYRVSAIYRNQWQNVTNAFSTVGLSADVTTNKNINIGLSIFNQAAGDGGYRFTNGYLTVAYNGIAFDREKYKRLAIGIQGGFVNRRFDPSKLQFGDQWFPGIGYSPTVPTGDGFAKIKAGAFDAGAGLAYYDGTPDKIVSPFGGISVFHLTQPGDPFLAGDKEKLPMRFSAHAGARIVLSDALTLVPSILYMRQGNAQEKMAGAYMQFYAGQYTDLLLGANWRINDAVSPFAGFTYNNFTVGVSYDVNASELGKMAKGSNSFEISLTYIGKRRNSVRTDYFKCPRL